MKKYTLKKVFKYMLLIIIVLCIIYIFICGWDIWTYSDTNQLVTCDGAIVLGAAAWNDEPSPVLKARIDHAVWLYENNYVDKIIFTGGRGENAQKSESEISRDYAVDMNVNPEDILIETKSTITEENIRYAWDIARENYLDTFIIVSDPLHMKRAITMARDRGMTVYPSPTTTSAYKSISTKLPFFFRELFFYIGYKLTLPFRKSTNN